jgi:hypothetical protein
LAGKAIRKVAIPEKLEIQEVTGNPMYNFNQYMHATIDYETEGCELLRQLTHTSHKLSKAFSHMILHYMHTHEKQYKRDLNRRVLVHKILSRVEGMLKFDEAHYSEAAKSEKQQTTLLNFFKFKQTQTQSVPVGTEEHKTLTFEQRKQKRAKKSFDELGKGLKAILSPKSCDKRVVLVRMNPRAKALVTRCANLFFFYQLGDDNAF